MCATTRLICPTWKGAGIPECAGVKLKEYGRSGDGWVVMERRKGTPRKMMAALSWVRRLDKGKDEEKRCGR